MNNGLEVVIERANVSDPIRNVRVYLLLFRKHRQKRTVPRKPHVLKRNSLLLEL